MKDRGTKYPVLEPLFEKFSNPNTVAVALALIVATEELDCFHPSEPIPDEMYANLGGLDYAKYVRDVGLGDGVVFDSQNQLVPQPDIFGLMVFFNNLLIAKGVDGLQSLLAETRRVEAKDKRWLRRRLKQKRAIWEKVEVWKKSRLISE